MAGMIFCGPWRQKRYFRDAIAAQALDLAQYQRILCVPLARRGASGVSTAGLK